jgi:hypothetical protein
VVRWEGAVDITIDEALAAMQPRKERRGQSAETFLEDVLLGRALPMKQVEEHGQRRGFSVDQLKGARRRLKLRSVRRGSTHGEWWWGAAEHFTAEEKRTEEKET